ncbi:MAG: hypothetical protein WCF04_04290 [Candidatus Nanopelagicales bacterium]
MEHSTDRPITEVEQRIRGELGTGKDPLLAAACSQWQSGRDGGSSRLRGAARVLTGIPHYFAADFITEHERAARDDVEMMRRGASLLRALAASELRDAGGWNAHAGLPARGFAGRGISAKPDVEAEILAAIASGHLDMPLWGLSLDHEVTVQYGGRFRFEVEGPFPAVAAWLESSEKPQEQELIAGGRYRVLGTHDEDPLTGDRQVTVVRLAFESPLEASTSDDPILLSVVAYAELAAAEHAGALHIWRETMRGVHWKDLEDNEAAQWDLRETMAGHLAAQDPRPIGDAELAAAARIAEVAHEEQVDKLGAPYIEHPRRVAARVQDDPVAHATALLHDVIEDGPYDHPQGREREFESSMSAIAERVGPQVAVAVHLLTRSPSQPDRDYYDRIRANPTALAVKLADIADNTDPARMAALDEKTRERLNTKYAHARALLAGAS